MVTKYVNNFNISKMSLLDVSNALHNFMFMGQRFLRKHGGPAEAHPPPALV